MPLEISYWNGRGKNATQIYGAYVSAESRSLSGTSAQSGATPSGSVIVRVEATEASRIAYGSNPTADTTTPYLGAGQVIEFEAVVGNKVAGKTP
jgi:hypothetical protein